MFYAIYLSRSTVSFSDKDLKKLLLGSRLRNGSDGVTGALIFHDGTFLQGLEGDESVVRATLARIGKDPRHNDIRILEQASHTENERMFGEWSMGFCDASDTAKLLKGFVAVDEAQDLAHISANSAISLLRATRAPTPPKARPASQSAIVLCPHREV